MGLHCIFNYNHQTSTGPNKRLRTPNKTDNCFDEIVVTRKREEIALLLKTLINRHNPNSHLALPDIAFPTLNAMNKKKETANRSQPEAGTSRSRSSSTSSFSFSDGSRDEMSHGAMQDMVVSFTCRAIKIGTYKYYPEKKVTISSEGVELHAPWLKEESRDVVLQIQLEEVSDVLVNFCNCFGPLIFLHTVPDCTSYVRDALGMVDDTGPYYNPLSTIEPHRRIALFPVFISAEAKMALIVLFGKTMTMLTWKEANDILVKIRVEGNSVAKATTRSSASGVSGAKSSGPTEIRQILIYPPRKDGIPINTADYMCLAQDQFLNDVIIEFYLKYLVRDILTHSQREKTHIFSTLFYKTLTTKPSKVNNSSNPHEWDNSLTAAQKRHLRVKTWTKNVNIFEKDFILVPINEDWHWFVAIICFPVVEGRRSMIDNRMITLQEMKKRGRSRSTQELELIQAIRRSPMQIGNTTITLLTKQADNLSERDDSEAEEMQCDPDDEEAEAAPAPTPKTEPIKQPCILIFDSRAGASRSRVVDTLRDYLTCEYQAKICPTKVYNKDNIKDSYPKIPQQKKNADCGLYLLQYVEQFFKDPIKDYTLPINELSSWFDEIVVTRKREEIALLLKGLVNRHNPKLLQALPDIAFPTLDGKSVETDEHEGESDAGKANPGTSKTLLKPSFSGAADATTRDSNTLRSAKGRRIHKLEEIENTSKKFKRN